MPVSRRALATVPALTLVAMACGLAGTPAEASVPLPLPSVSPLALPTTLLGVPLPLPSSSPLPSPLATPLPTAGLPTTAPAPAPAPAPAAGTGSAGAPGAPRTQSSGAARVTTPRTVGSQSVPLALPLAPESFTPAGGALLSLPATRLDALDGRAPSIAAPTLAAPLPTPAPTAPALAIPYSGDSSTSLPPAAVAAAFLALAGAVAGQLRVRRQG